jgi:hypothetical protein
MEAMSNDLAHIVILASLLEKAERAILPSSNPKRGRRTV